MPIRSSATEALYGIIRDAVVPGKLTAITGPEGVAQTGIVNDVAERRGLDPFGLLWGTDVAIVGSPEEYLEGDSFRAVVNFKVPYDLRLAFACMLQGWPYRTANGYRRHLPEVYRNWNVYISDNWQLAVPQRPVAYCTKTKIVGSALRSDWSVQNPEKPQHDLNRYYPDPRFESAIVTAVFETLPFPVLLLSEITELPHRPAEMQRFCRKTEKSGGRFLQFSTGQWVLQNGPGGATRPAANRNQNFYESFNTIVYEWYDVLPGMSAYEANQALRGKTNAAQFDNYPAQTLILTDYDRTPRKNFLGQEMYNYRIEFIEIRSGVNKALPPGSTNIIPEYWDIVKLGTESTTRERPYQPADFSLLFKP